MAKTSAKTSVTIPSAQAEIVAKCFEAFAAARGAGGQEELALALVQADGVRCTNGAVGCNIKLPTGIREDICFPARILSTAMLSAKADVQLTQEGTSLIVKTGGFLGRFSAVPAERYLTPPETPGQWYVASAEGWAGIGQSQFAAATDMNKHPGMIGVFTQKGVAYACDNLRVCRCAAKGWPDGFISTALLNAVEKSGLGAPQHVAVLEDKTWLMFENGSTCWGANPQSPYPEGIPARVRECSQSVGKVSALGWDPVEVLQAVQRLTLFTTPDQPVLMTGEGKTVVFHAAGPMGEVKETVRAEVRKPTSIHISSSLLLEAVGKFEDCAIEETDKYAMFRTRGKELMIVGVVV